MAETGESEERPRGVTGKVPEPRARRSVLSRVLYPLFITATLICLIGAGLLAYGYSLYDSAGPLEANKVFEVRRGLQTPEIAADLEQAGIISNANIFTAAVLASGKRNTLKAGEYEFPARGTMRDVINLIVSGKAILYKVSVPEGFTTEQALKRVRENPVLAGDLTVTPAEGALMPDTYLFRRGKTRNELVQDMINAQNKLNSQLWATRNPDVPVKTPEEAVILASIVEKETGIAEERPRVAAVFANRLKKRMRLQSDPTIIYGITQGKTKLERSLTRADIAAANPYNTYRINGLPPGPIANPGRAALQAVLNPIASKDLYFVADGTGGHAFAETLEQHNANVAKWRKLQQADDAPVQDDSPETPAAAAAPDDTAAKQPEAVAAVPQSETPAPEPKAADTPTDEPGAPKAEPIPEELPPAPTDTAAIPKPDAPDTAAQQATADAPAEEQASGDLKPGAVLKLANRLVPIPIPKPKNP